MTTGDDIRKARENKGWSQSDLARAAGVSQAAVSKIEAHRERITRSRFLPEILEALKMTQGNTSTAGSVNIGYRPPAEILDANDKMPVYASVEGGAGIIYIDPVPIDWVPRPANLTHVRKAFAVVVTGDSMVPVYKPGDRAMVNPHGAPQFGEDCIVYSNNEETGDQRAMIKEYVRQTDTEWVLKQYNPEKELRLQKAEWHTILRVVGRLNKGS